MKNMWVRGAGVVVAALGIATGGVACGPPAKTQADVDKAREAGIAEGRALVESEIADAAQTSAIEADVERVPYRLHRETWQVTVTPRPIVRTRCWISTQWVQDGGVEPDRDERVVEWDPSTSDSPDRFVTLRRGSSPSLRCAAESSNVGSGNRPDTITYLFKNADGGLNATSDLLHISSGTSDAGPTVTAKRWSDAGAVPYSSRVNPPVSQGGQRSLDPLTPLFTELATVIAEVAVERAKSGAQEMAKERLRDFVCKIGYGVENDGQAGPLGGVHECSKTEECKSVFKKTCSSIDFLRVEELAASAEVLGRGLAGDLTEYAFETLKSVLSKRETDRVVTLTVDSLNRSLQALIDGNAIRTERDFQALLLGLSDIPVGTKALKARLESLKKAASKENSDAGKAAQKSASDALDALASNRGNKVANALHSAIEKSNAAVSAANAADAGSNARELADAARDVRATLESESWRCAVGMGSAVLRECLERDTCSADVLRTSFERELREPSEQCEATLAIIHHEWPELPTILARAVDVMRPPPGTTPAQTAKAATVIVLEVLEKRALWRSDSRGAADKVEPIRTAFDATKALTTALFDRDYAGAAVASTRLISSAVAQCEKDDSTNDESSYCNSLDPARLKKSVALLNGFVSYAASYRKEPSGASDGKSDAEREKARRDERKKAMNDLVDAMTDRSGRAGEHVFSFGVAVGLALGRKADVDRGGSTAAQQGYVDPMPNLSLPVGLAWDLLPKRVLGVHAQLSLLDVGQFLVVSKDGEVQDKPSFATAFLIGGQVGVLLGSPKYSFLLGTDLGYAPGMKLPDVDKPGVWRVGGFVGTYIPFIDFN